MNSLISLLQSDKTSFFMEAHNGISAKIVEKVGFDGVWASGLSIATSLGVRDNNELSWKTIVDIVSYIASAIDIPVLVDGDTGFGDFNNARIFAKQLRQIGASGVSLED